MYQALYRKWRPQVFADVVGQQHITTTLMNEINAGRHSHAYLFTGSRGTGKTTCAKIFAKAVNCEHPVNGDPCNECETCRGLDSGSILDVIEIDAASNNGVDNIRDIRDEANFTPVSGKYRVYIIDEVHMLSQGAFNALLKTLEEPPEHVKFVLATTEVHKLPATILSRCQRFDFKRITPEGIASRLGYIAEKEGLTLDNEAAMLIARLADGALRDALSIMDQCIGHNRNITVQVVNDTVGLAGKEYLFALSDAILRNDGAVALDIINDLHNRSCDMDRLCNELINHFRNIMVCKAVKSPQNLIICSEPELRDYANMASAYQMDRILEVLNVLGDTLTNLRKGLNRRVETEMAIIRLCSGITGTAPATYVASAVLAKPVAPTPAKPAVPIPTSASTQPVNPVPSVQTTSTVPADPAVPVPAAPIAESAPEPLPFPEDAPPMPDDTAIPAPSFEPIPAPLFETEPAAAPIPEPVTDPAPQPESAVSAEPIPTVPEHISLTESLPDGPIPMNVWNALIREVVTTDKLLIGTMNSAKAYKVGETLQVLTDNMLLKRFLPMEEHKQVVYNATFTVLGEYLRPMIVEEEPVITESVTVANPADTIPITEPVPVVQTAPIVDSEPFLASVPEPVLPAPQEEPQEIDPLDAFINNINKMTDSDQIDFSLFIEE